MNMMWLKPLLGRTRQALIKNAPHILMALGTTGSATAVIFAAKAAPAAREAKNEAMAEKAGTGACEKLTMVEWLKACGKFYIPAVGMEVFSLMCFWGAHGIDVKRQAVLAGLYSTAEAAMQEYQKKVVDMIGKDGEAEIRKSIAQDHVEALPAQTTVILPGDTDMWCLFDNQMFRSNYLHIKESENDANHEMIQNMYISKAELMWMLDPDRKYLKPGPNDGQVGWSLDRLIHLNVESVLGENHQPVLVVTVTDKNGLDYPPEAGFSMLRS